MADEEEKPKPGILGAVSTKVWAGIIAALAAGVLWFGEATMTWGGGQLRAALHGTVGEIVRETLRADLEARGEEAILRPAMDDRLTAALQPEGLIALAFAERSDAAISGRLDAALAPDGMITTAVAQRIDAALDARVGTAVAGELRFSPEEPSRTLRFYVPAAHQIDLSLRVRDLGRGEVIRVGASSFAGGGAATIDRNGVYSIDALRQPDEETLSSGPALLGQPVTEEIGRMRNLLPLTLLLDHADPVLAAAAEGLREPPELTSQARIEFVALLTPPLKVNHD